MVGVLRIGIIGAGKLGTYLLDKINAHPKLELAFLVSRHLPQAIEIDEIDEIVDVPDVIFITTADADIRITAKRLAFYFADKLKGKYVFHFAGCYDRSLLASCEQYGALTAVLHPFQAISGDEDNINYGIECDTLIWQEVKLLVGQLGGIPHLLPDSIDKALYHSVGVVATNYLTGVIQLTKELAKKANISFTDFVLPTIMQTVANCTTDDDIEKFPITGPLLRGDFATIIRHLVAMKPMPELSQAYSHFGIALLSLLEEHNMLEDRQYNQTEQVFQNYNKNQESKKTKRMEEIMLPQLEVAPPTRDIDNTLLVLGLGNPGSRYSRTRHNIGFMVAKRLIDRYKAKIKHLAPLADMVDMYLDAGNSTYRLVVAMPQTLMNNSGLAAKALLNRLNMQPENMLVVLDEYNFPVGKVHIKFGGNDGGHNGMKSIINELGTNDFYRLRCGIDRNFGMGELVNYVLSPFEQSEKNALEQMIEHSLIGIEYFLCNDPARAMSFINSGQLFGMTENILLNRILD
jgi:PTH1 family peptidyl-tRNA hydrolase